MPDSKKAELRWNAQSKNVHEEHIWHLLIINRPARIDKIIQLFEEQARPTEDHQITYDKKVDRNLWARLYTCKGERFGPQNIERHWPEIYNGKITRDHELREKPKDGILNYVEKYISEKFS